jgi:hypothetical protein
MTSSGRLIAFLIGVVIAFMLPKKVVCGFPGADCGKLVDKRWCKEYEVEPWGFYLLEHLFDTDIGFAYSRGFDC